MRKLRELSVLTARLSKRTVWYLYLGQLPIDAATGIMPEGVEAQARQSLENIRHILEAAGLTMADIVKTTVFLQDMSLFAG